MVQRREGGRRPAANPIRDGVRLRVRRPAASHELPALPRGHGARADAAKVGPLRGEAARAAALRRAEGGVLPGGFRPGRGRTGRARPVPRASAGGAHASGGVALPPLPEPALPPRARAAGAGRHAGRGAASHESAARRAARPRPVRRAGARGGHPKPGRIRRPGDSAGATEPGGGGSRDARLHDIRGPAWRRGRGAPEGGSPAQAYRPGRGERGAALGARRLADAPRPARTRQTAPLGRRMMRSLTTSVNARRLGQVGVDACLLGLAYYLAYVLRFDSGIPDRYEELLRDTIALTVAMKLVIFAMFGLYSKLWRFVDQKDFESILKAVVISTVGLIVVLFLFSIGRHDPPRGVL